MDGEKAANRSKTPSSEQLMHRSISGRDLQSGQPILNAAEML
jgi:hypothetical protein